MIDAIIREVALKELTQVGKEALESKRFLHSSFDTKLNANNGMFFRHQTESFSGGGKGAFDGVGRQTELDNRKIDNIQKKVINETFRKVEKGEVLSSAEKGNWGEMMMDQYYIQKGYKPIHYPRVQDLEHKAGQGIDGVYEKINPDGTKSYIIGEAKVNNSKLNKELSDGTKQMDDVWIRNRLDDAVGKEKAEEIRNAFEDNPDSVSKEVYRFDYENFDEGMCRSYISYVDIEGEQGKELLVQSFDSKGHVIPGGERDVTR